MRPCVRVTCLLTVVLVLGLAPAARAFDVTGTWAGTYKCKGIFDGFKDSFTDELGAIITQEGDTLGALVSFDGEPFGYTGITIPNAAKPDKGELALTGCGTDDDLTSGDFDELARLAVKTNPAKGSGGLAGISVYTTTEPFQVYTCKWKLKRTTILNAMVPQFCK